VFDFEKMKHAMPYSDIKRGPADGLSSLKKTLDQVWFEIGSNPFKQPDTADELNVLNGYIFVVALSHLIL